MGIQKPELFQKVTEQPGVWSQEAGNGWSKGCPMKIKGAIGEKMLDFFLLYPFDIGIFGIVHVEVIPEDDALWFLKLEVS